MSLPKRARSSELLLSELERLREADVGWRHGRAFSLACFAGGEVLALATNACARFPSEDAVNAVPEGVLGELIAELRAAVESVRGSAGRASAYGSIE